MTWFLSLCIGVSAMGCGSRALISYPTEADCYKALKEMRTGDGPTAESGSKRNTVAYCYPDQSKRK